MKRRILAASLVIFLALTAVSFTGAGTIKATGAQTFEKVDFISGVVTSNELNLRSGPSTDYSIIGTFQKYKWVNVLAQIGDWYAVFDPDSGKVGCVAKAYLADASKIDKSSAGNAAPAPHTAKATSTPKPSASATPQQTGDLSQDEKLLLDLINKERAASNVPPLAADPELMKVARLKATDMSQNNYFSHFSPTYGSPFDMMRQFGITFKAAAENIAGNSTVQGAVSSWMKSEGHKTNIMNPTYNFTGIGIAKNNKYGYVFVQQFIKK
ncbi:MAG: CAP domain-containing protein [Clostridia bacterium]|nr:CAP domain-containing protein [Clostridia bacterium]